MTLKNWAALLIPVVPPNPRDLQEKESSVDGCLVPRKSVEGNGRSISRGALRSHAPPAMKLDQELRMPLSQPVCNAPAAGLGAQRRERSLRTASSISASSSLRVRVTSSPALSPLSRVMGNSAPPPGGGPTKHRARAAISFATSRLESNTG